MFKCANKMERGKAYRLPEIGKVIGLDEEHEVCFVDFCFNAGYLKILRRVENEDQIPEFPQMDYAGLLPEMSA